MPAEVIVADAAGIARAASLIREGAVVGYPTETCYGLAVRACDAQALQALFRVKGRQPAHPVSVLVSDRAMVASLVTEVCPSASALIDAHWPGPLTLVLPARPGLPASLVSASGGIGLRMSSDPIAQALVTAVGEPLTATSANISGDFVAEQAASAALDGVALVLDGGPRNDAPSTVFSLIGAPRVLRQGPIPLSVSPHAQKQP